MSARISHVTRALQVFSYTNNERIACITLRDAMARVKRQAVVEGSAHQNEDEGVQEIAQTNPSKGLVV